MAYDVLREIGRAEGLRIYTQDDPGFPEEIADRVHDADLEVSYRLGIETVPTLLQNLVQCAAGEGNFLINIGPQFIDCLKVAGRFSKFIV